MSDVLRYRNYVGSAEVDVESNICFGRLLFIRDVVAYSADTPSQLRAEFEAVVDEYLKTCEELGRTPETTCSGSFNVRIPPEMHMAVALEARRCGITLNALVKDAISARIGSPMVRHEHAHTLVVEVVGGWQKVQAASFSSREASTWNH